MLIEADGSRGLPLKAPRAHEPVIPSEATLVIPIASLSVLGQPLDEDHVYNAAAIDERYGFGIGNRVKSPWVAQVLRDEELGLRGIPDRARVIALLNQTPATGYLRARARMIAGFILRSHRVKGVALGLKGWRLVPCVASILFMKFNDMSEPLCWLPVCHRVWVSLKFCSRGRGGALFLNTFWSNCG